MTLGHGQGLVVSDLHFFAKRSHGISCLESLDTALSSAPVLVLNGDTFDFRWSTLANDTETEAEALGWLRRLLVAYPQTEVHFVLGNHDCLPGFVESLKRLAKDHGRFHWHEYCLQIGTSLFLHGDCSQRVMDATGLDRYRQSWRRPSRRGRVATTAYRCSDRMGLTRLVHRWHFPREQTVARVCHYLDDCHPGWRSQILDCYFGHTHLPFAAYTWNGIRFHNTGSGIRGMRFNPLRFDLAQVV